MSNMIRLLKLSDNDDPMLTGGEILFIHIGHYLTHGKVAFSTDIAMADQPKYVLLALGNVDDICYLCHVEDYVYKKEAVLPEWNQYAPDRYKNTSKKTWLLFDSMKKIPIDFLDELLQDTMVHEFIKNRANNKILGI